MARSATVAAILASTRPAPFPGGVMIGPDPTTT
jgi:hypothetical protein